MEKEVSYSIILSPQAIGDFNGIFDYIAQDSLAAAIKFTNELKEQISNLSSFPYIGKEDKENKCRCIIKKPYVIYYALNEEKKKAEILHIRHSARKPYIGI